MSHEAPPVSTTPSSPQRDPAACSSDDLPTLPLEAGWLGVPDPAVCRTRIYRPEPTNPPLYVTIDGPNGVGKSTLIASLHEQLRLLLAPALDPAGDPNYGDVDRNITIITTQEPWNRPWVFEQVAKADGDRDKIAAIFERDRAAHQQRVVARHYTAGHIIISDRSRLSTAVLQYPEDWSGYLKRAPTLAIQPDLRIILNAHPDLLLRRLTARDASSPDPHRPIYDPSTLQGVEQRQNLERQREIWSDLRYLARAGYVEVTHKDTGSDLARVVAYRILTALEDKICRSERLF